MMINKKQMWSDNPFNQWTEEELLCMKYQGICYGKGGGSAPPPPPSTQTVRQSSEFPEELKPFVSDIFGKAKAIQEQRQEEGFRPELTQQLASFTPDQQAAFTGIREQVGQTRPLFQEATDLTRGATRAATDPAEVAALMNPFLRNVTDIEKREAQRVADVEEQQLAAQAAKAGAFGGSRAAILEAERQRNLNQQLGDIEARGRLAAFQDAQARLQNQFGREAAGAAQLSALGTAIPAQTFKELGALSGIGAAEQQQAQRALDIATQQAREEYGFPMATLQDFQSILRGFPLPATTNVSKQTFSPAQPLSTQLLGLGTGLAGLAGVAGAFKKAGGLVGAPVAMKNGGYVKLAGGGGLGQLMQGKLPSNRVRMGKTAYQDASKVPTSPVASMPELSVLNYLKLYPNSKKMVEDIVYSKIKNIGDKEEQSKAALAFLNMPISDVFPRSKEKPDVAGDVATQSIQSAGAAPSPDVPIIPTDQAKSPADLSLLQKAMGTIDNLVTGVDTSGARPSKDPFSMTPAPASVVDSRVPSATASLIPAAAPALVSAPPVGGSTDSATVPVNMAGMDPTAADAIPKPGMLQSLQQGMPYKIDALTTQYTPPPPAPPIPSAELRSNAATGDFSPAEGYTERGRKALEKYNVPLGVRPELGDMPVQTEKLGFSPETTEDVRSFLGGTPEGRNPVQRLINTIGADRGITEGLDFFATGADAAGKAVGSLAGIGEYLTTPNFQSVPDAAVLAEREKLIAAGKKDPAPADIGDPDAGPKDATGGMFPDDPGVTSIQESEKAQAAAQANADAVRKEAEAAEPDGGAAADGATNKNAPSPGTNSAQIDYNAKIAEFKDKDYSAEVEKALGPAPTYEKGEEPDFASQKYLTLLGISGRILSSNKPALQALGDAVQPAIKELADIGKEERKIQRELRQERNAQKRADYQDKSARFNMQRQLRGDDIDMFTSLARLKAQEDSNAISRQNANTNAARAISENAYRKFKRTQEELNARLENKGQLKLSYVDKLLASTRASASKNSGALAKNDFGVVDPKKVRGYYEAAYNAQLPSILESIDGRVVDEKGVVVPRERLMKLLGLDAASKPAGSSGQTYNRDDGSSFSVAR